MLRRWSALAVVLALVSSVPAANATVLWEGDFEDGDLSDWDSSNLITGPGDRMNLILQGEHFAQGMTAAEITLREDIIFEPYNQSRVEVKHNGLNTEDGDDSYFVWSFMVPAAAEIRSNIGYWESLVSFQNTMTFYIEPGDAGTDVVFGTGFLGENVQWSAPLELNVWHRMAIHNHWSQDEADGRVNVWFDGVQVVTDVVATKVNGDPLFFQMGLHRSDPSPPVQVIYIDAAMEADSLDDILMPLPDPNPAGGSGGTGGVAGGGGAAGSAGTAGSGGSSAGSLAGGAGGAGGSAGAVLAGSGGAVGGAGQGGTGPLAQPQTAPTQSGGCALGRTSSAGARALALLLGVVWLARRRRLRTSD